MKLEEKVVSIEMGHTLQKSGWKDYTAVTWMKFTDEWRLTPTFEVNSLVEIRRAHQLSHTHYAAPDVSELLNALHDRGRLQLTIDSRQSMAELTYEVGKGMYQCHSADTLTNALGKLWCAVHARIEEPAHG